LQAYSPYFQTVREPPSLLAFWVLLIDRSFFSAITYIITGKKHHVSIFPKSPQDGDKNGNVKAGTVIDRTITNPFTFDWYLQSVSLPRFFRLNDVANEVCSVSCSTLLSSALVVPLTTPFSSTIRSSLLTFFKNSSTTCAFCFAASDVTVLLTSSLSSSGVTPTLAAPVPSASRLPATTPTSSALVQLSFSVRPTRTTFRRWRVENAISLRGSCSESTVLVFRKRHPSLRSRHLSLSPKLTRSYVR
jgi:hypothetical protein